MKKFFVFAVTLTISMGSLNAQAKDIIRADGSSTVFPITEAVAEEFQAAGGNKAMVGISGTGGGFKRFCRGETDISNASRPIKEKEIQSCREANIDFIEIPVAFDGLAVVMNPENTWVDHLTVAELKKIWAAESQGVVTNWSQVREGFPDVEIRLFGPGTDSGTFDYFTEAVNGKSGNSRGDYTASEDDNVLVEGVAHETGGLGYFGIAYYEQNKDKLKVVPIEGGNGPVVPSLETVMDGTYSPLARPIFIYVSTAAAGKEYIKKFVEFYLENASALVEEVGYIPLQPEAYEAGLARFQAGKTGAPFSDKSNKGKDVVEVLKMK